MQTKWCVITGGPSSGKTTTVNLLRERGYKTTIEHARHYIDTMLREGHGVEETRKDQTAFQLGVLEMQIEQEAELDPNELVFLDRAIPDALAYYRFLGLEPHPRLVEAIRRASYWKVFVLDMLPIIHDYARTEDAAAQRRIHQLLVQVYTELSLPIVLVPVMPPADRVDLILNNN